MIVQHLFFAVHLPCEEHYTLYITSLYSDKGYLLLHFLTLNKILVRENRNPDFNLFIMANISFHSFILVKDHLLGYDYIHVTRVFKNIKNINPDFDVSHSKYEICFFLTKEENEE